MTIVGVLAISVLLVVITAIKLGAGVLVTRILRLGLAALLWWHVSRGGLGLGQAFAPSRPRR